MKKNGFTFIEILGVITLLALISVIVLITVDKSLKTSKQTLYESQIENIKNAASMWRTDNIELIPNSGYYNVTLEELQNSGYIKTDIENPKTNEYFDKSMLVSMSMNDILVGDSASDYLTSTYGCDDITTFCIRTRSDLEKLANEVNNGDNKSGKTYVLIQNIDLGGKFDSDGNALEGNVSWTSIGSDSKPFSGIFDGAGHIISGMYINSSSARTALFSTVTNGTIKNLGIEKSYIISSEEYTASIVGFLENSNISNCYSKANVYGQKLSAGIVGRIVSNSTVQNCYNTGNVKGAQFTAGIVGYVGGSSSVVENCYNIGFITSTSDVAGIAGGSQGQVYSCYNLGTISTSSSHKSLVGGIVGQMYLSPKVIGNYNTGIANGGIVGYFGPSTNVSDTTITDNYYLDTSSEYGIFQTSSNEGASPLSKNEMPDVLSVINDDNAFVADVKGINNGYPILNWQQ